MPPAVNEPAVNGPAVNGPAVNGPAVNGPAVNGPAVNGPADPAPPPAAAGTRKAARKAANRRSPDPVAPATAALGPVLVAAAGGAMLAAAEGRPWPAAVTPAVALLAHLLVDRGARLHLPVLPANLLGLGAAGLAVTELTAGGIEARLLFGAHLLVYLSWIVLLQRKTFKVCWSLIALAVLQVAVASVLASGGAVGAGLLGFLGLSLGALVNLNARWPADRQRRPAAGGAANVPPGLAVGGSRVEPGRATQAGGGRLAWTVLGVTGAALVIGASAFLVTPRTWLSRRPPMDPSRTEGIGLSYTGFTGEVRLGALGEILESRALAFEVSIERPGLDRSFASHGVSGTIGTEEPLFRGRALDNYNRGRWTDSLEGEVDYGVQRRWPGGSSVPNLIERYRLRPIGDRVLFRWGPAGALSFDRQRDGTALRREVDDLLVRPRAAQAGREVDYTVVSGIGGRRRDRPDDLPAEFRPRYLQRPGRLPAVAAAAAEALRGGRPGASDPGASDPGASDPGASDPEAADDRAVAARLTAYLRDSGRFVYSLDQSVTDPTVDAAEDFLANRRSGHCEYFATALALMLRDRGIPSRMVTGFKGGELNAASGRLHVEQRHAHAWVEAYVGGRWETFDATPAAARTASVAERGPRFRVFTDLARQLEAVWAEYVVRMSLERQRATFFTPFQQAWGDLTGWLARTAEGRRAGPNAGRVDLTAGAAAGGGLLGLAGLAWAVWRLPFARWWRRRRADRARAGTVAFYRRFAALAARRGLTRGPAETPAEFGPRAAAGLRDVLTGDLAGLPAALAETLYAVRFGGAPLSPERAAGLAASLDDLETRLKAAR